jgi:hypothetical protein
VTEAPTPPKRPLAVTLYCGAIAVVFVIALAALVIAISLRGDLDTGDLALSFVPAGLLLVGAWGVWGLRWWGVAGLFLVVIAGEALTLGPGAPPAWMSLVRIAIWLVPLSIIALVYRRRFR